MYIGLTALSVIGISILFGFLLIKYKSIAYHLGRLMKILAPFIYGFAIAYILVPVYNLSRRLTAPLLDKCKISGRWNRILSKTVASIVSLAFIVLVVGGLIYLVLPQVSQSIVSIVNDIPKAAVKIQTWLEALLADNPQLEETVSAYMVQGLEYLEHWAKTDLLPQMNTLVTNVSMSIFNVLLFLKNIVLGLIVAVYMLNSKETFSAQGKMLLYGTLKKSWADSVLGAFTKSHQVFGGFINGKLLDSFIIGILCFIGMSILRLPYVMLISIIVGVTNIIPFFGPFFGAIPSALIILMISPKQCLYFVLFILLLQQLDGNVIGPKILGDSTGLSGFWVMFSIILFGGMWGFVGMVVGVPIFAVFYYFISGTVKKSLEKKGMPRERSAYEAMDQAKQEQKEKSSNTAGKEGGMEGKD